MPSLCWSEDPRQMQHSIGSATSSRFRFPLFRSSAVVPALRVPCHCRRSPPCKCHSNIEKLCGPRPWRTGLPTPKAKGDRKAEGLCGARVIFSNRTVDLYIKKTQSFAKFAPRNKAERVHLPVYTQRIYVFADERALCRAPFCFWSALPSSWFILSMRVAILKCASPV